MTSSFYFGTIIVHRWKGDVLLSNWFSLKENIPNKNEEVLVCRKTTDGDIVYFTAVYKGKNKNWFGGHKWLRDGMFFYGWDIDSIRWQHLTPCEDFLPCINLKDNKGE